MCVHGSVSTVPSKVCVHGSVLKRLSKSEATTAESRSQAALLAGALGLDKAWTRSGLKTGQAMIICGRYKEVIATVPADEDPATSLEKLHDALAMVPQH